MIAPQADPLDKTSLVGLARGSRRSGLRSPAHVALNGVFISDGVAKAFLITTQSPVGVWVQVNGQIDGWRVAAVTPEHVVLEGQSEKLTVPLRGGR